MEQTFNTLCEKIRERVIRARTIADLAGAEKIQSMHIAEAIGYRNLDRGDWALSVLVNRIIHIHFLKFTSHGVTEFDTESIL